MTMNDAQQTASSYQPQTASSYQRAISNQQRDSSGRLDASLTQLINAVDTLREYNGQLERMADRLTGEVPTPASVTKLGQPSPPLGSVTHAIDAQLQMLVQELSRQHDALMRLNQLWATDGRSITPGVHGRQI